jgi:hypothetical protein
MGIEKRDNLDLDLHLLSFGLSRRCLMRDFAKSGDREGR